jgi:DNA-binding CsgD family transcriptional regulator
VLIGRDRELRIMTRALDDVPAGNGISLVLRGEAGIGKSRLVREAIGAARARSLTLLVGRCVQEGQGIYRPFVEALMAVARSGVQPDSVELRPFRHALGALVPDWREEEGGEDSPVAVAEGVLRLGRSLAGTAGTLMVVEDLHWADPGTLAVLEYLADNVADQPLVLVVTLRPAEASAADDLVARLADRGAAAVVELDRLSGDEVASMVTTCTTGPTRDLVDVVTSRSEGVPLLVEELLSIPAAGISDAVPATFGDTVARRLETLSAESALVVQCAAVLGRRFDWRLLPPVTGLPEVTVRRGLADGVDLQLLVVDRDGDIHFRHALTRDAVLMALLPPSRIALTRRAAQAVDAACSDSPGTDDDGRVQLSADLWRACGEPDIAARRLLEAGRRAIGQGALSTAERLLGQLHTLPVVDESIRLEVAEALTETFALMARVEDAFRTGDEALTLLDDLNGPAERRGRLHLLLARAADTATRWDVARNHLTLAAGFAAESGDLRLRTAVDALAAHVAIGELRYDDAERLATGAAARAADLQLPDVACEALEVLGRLERMRDLGKAEEIFERAHAIARDNDLALRSVRALHELGTIEMFRRSSSTRARRASELAYRAGALSLAASVDLQLIGLHAFLFEIDEAVTVGARVVQVAAALGLTDVHVTALLQLGFAYAIAGRVDAMEDTIEDALRLAGDHPEAQAYAWGHARATASLLAEDRTRALEQLSIAQQWARDAPGVGGVFVALDVLLRVLAGAGSEAIDEVRDRGAMAIPVNIAIVEMAYAVLDARAEDRVGAGARVAAATEMLRSQRMDAWLHLGRRYVAEAALGDHWGAPQQWLAEAAEFFQQTGHTRVAIACRDLLRRAGLPAPRGGPTEVPERLRALGVTSREAQVLRLLGERQSNREIAARLYLSPRTVEKHVEHLLHKTGAPGRAELGRLARDQYGSASHTGT